MCLETMDLNLENVKTVRRNVKLGPRLRWRQLRVNEGDAAVRRTIRNYNHRQQKRAQLLKVGKTLRVVLNNNGQTDAETVRVVYVKEGAGAMLKESSRAAYMRSHPAGAMAPSNTTQYLMGRVYEDMSDDKAVPASPVTKAHLYDESLSPMGVYAALDCDYESCLAFQERDFEEAYGP